MSDDWVLCIIIDGVVDVCFNWVDKRNVLDFVMFVVIVLMGEWFCYIVGVWVVVLLGEGVLFCVGFDFVSF